MEKNLLLQQSLGSTLEINNNYYTSSKNSFRALYIPMYQAPCVLEDDIPSMKRYVFYNSQTYTLSFDGDNYFVLSTSHDSVYNQVNFFATTLYRSYYNTYSSSDFTIYGPALIIGMDEDTQYTSVSVDILDATINLMTRYQYEI
jgi:hypothetical protein